MFNWITENVVIEWKINIEDAGYIERILWADRKRDMVVSIQLENEKAMPQVRTFNEYMSDKAGQIHKIIDWIDPKTGLVDEKTIPDKSKEIRDKAWNVIRTMIRQEPDIYIPKYRGNIVSEIVSDQNVHKTTVYKYLRRYWQGGKMRNALLPLYDNCGAGGKERNEGSVKRGRPRKFAEKTDGVNISEDIKQAFRSGVSLFYNTKEKAPLKRAFQKTLEKFFYSGYHFDGEVRIPILQPEDKLPSFGQFKYWFNKELDLKDSITKRYGSRKYDLNYRPILGSSTQESFGPGSRFQIDATIADVYLVSEYKREWIIGRPVIYVVIDVFSRVITGIYVGLEGPSWLGAMMALANTTMDKVKFCADYDIKIEPEEWLCSHLPQILTADRGELEGHMPSDLIKSLGVDLENSPPYRADWKGIVEQRFRILNLQTIKWMPGAVQARNKERGERDYRQDAKLTLYEFTQIMIRNVLYHNNNHYMEWYDRNEYLVSDDIDPIPSQLWNWGIQNRTGRLKRQHEDIVKLNLLYQGTATVTGAGILFKGMSYGCDLAMKEQWFTKARYRGSWRIPVRHDPRTTNQIYLWLEDGRKFETCTLLEREERFLNKRFEEVVDLIEIENHSGRLKSSTTMQAKIKLDAHAESIVKNATKKTNEAIQHSGMSKNKRVKETKSHRKTEKELNREHESFSLGEQKTENKQVEILPFNKDLETESKYIAPAKKTSLIQSILGEMEDEENERE